jgi:hypothetical protein
MAQAVRRLAWPSGKVEQAEKQARVRKLLESCSITTRHIGPLATHLHQFGQAQLDRILEED